MKIIGKLKNKYNNIIAKKNSSLEYSNLYYYALNGILYTIGIQLYKSYANKFIYRLGGNEFHIALYTALPGFIAVFTTLPGIIFMSKIKNKKQSITRSFYCSRFFLLLFALVPFLPNEYRAITFVLLISLMNFPESVSTAALQSYVGDIFEEETISTALTTRNSYSTFVQIIISLMLGQFMKLISIKFSDNFTIIAYQLLFILAFIVGLKEISALKKLKEIREEKQKKINIRSSLSGLKKEKKYIIFIVCSLIFHFGWQMGWPLFSIYQIQYLGADELWLSITNMSSSIVMVISYMFWNKTIVRKGNGFVMAYCSLGMAITPLLFVISPNLLILTVVFSVSGFFTSGTVTVILNSLLEVAPEKNRAFFVAFHVTLTNITLCISPLVGNYILANKGIIFALIMVSILRVIGSITFFIRNKFFYVKNVKKA